MFNNTETLTIAVPKGRVLEEIIPLFDSMKLSFFDNPFKSRKLIFKTSNPKIRIILCSATKCPTYVKMRASGTVAFAKYLFVAVTICLSSLQAPAVSMLSLNRA